MAQEFDHRARRSDDLGDRSYLTLRDGFIDATFQPRKLSGLATIRRSLRDIRGPGLDLVEGFYHTPSHRPHGFEDEDDDENEVSDKSRSTIMNTLSNQLVGPIQNEPKDGYFHVVHPLDDLPEEKVKTDHLPPLAKSGSVLWSLFILRAYLIVMMLLLAYHMVDLVRQLWR